MTYPCSFEEAAPKSLEEMLPHLKPDSWRKVRTLSDAIHGKVKLVEGYFPDQPKTFVVKQIPKAVANSPQGLECPRNEIHASLTVSQGLQVPNAVEVLFAGQDEKHFYLASEHCTNGELLSVVNRAGRLENDALLREVLCQILVAVRALHEAGVAHRDLSLENVLVAADGGLRIIDYAQAVLVRGPDEAAAAEAPVSQEQGLPGKPHYQSPELASGSPYLATKVDTFAVGVMLYALVVGTYPFMPKTYLRTEDTRKLGAFPQQARVIDRLKACGNLAETISPGCLDMMEQLLAPNPNKRLSAAEALVHPWLTGAVSGLWPAAVVYEDDADDASTDCTGDADKETDCSESNCGDIAN